MNVSKATAADFLCLFAGQADMVSAAPASPAMWRERAEDLAAFLAAHEEVPPDAASFTTMLHVGGLLMLMAARPDDGGAA